MKKYKKVQPTQKSIMADPRVEDLFFEGGGRRFGQTAWENNDIWECSLDGYADPEIHITSLREPTLRDIADILNSGDLITVEEHNKLYPLCKINL